MMKLDWEQILTKAAEDGKSYLHALMLWSNPTKGYNPDYILILVLTNRARIRHVLKLIETDIPSNYFEYREQLNALWSEAEKMLGQDVFQDTERVKAIISVQFVQRLNSIEDELKKIRHLAQDGNLTGDYDWIAEDLRETAHDFLLNFRDMALVNDELKGSPLEGTEEYGKFHGRFNEIENLFKKYFGYFYLVSDLFAPIREREYKMNYWWLNTIPKAEKVQEEEIPETVIRKIQDIYKSVGKITTGNCPEKERLIAYAFDELTYNERLNIRSHILECRLCLDLVIDMCYAEAVSKEIEGNAAYKRFFETVLNRLLSTQEVPVISEPTPLYTPDIVGFLLGVILVQQIQIRAPRRRVAYGEEQIALELTSELKNAIKLRLKLNESGKYILPDSYEEEYCDSPEDYEKINDFVRQTRTYWGGLAVKADGSIREFEPDLIRDLSLSKLIRLDPEENYKHVIICIAGKQEDLQEGLKALEKKDKKTISSLNVVWLICSLE